MLSFLNDIIPKLDSAGIKTLPAEQIYYNEFLYKVNFLPKHADVNSIKGYSGCRIEISNTKKGRKQLDEFTTQVNKLFTNADFRDELKEFVKNHTTTKYYTRSDGEGVVFYFKDIAIINILVETYGDMIEQIAGPISQKHVEIIKNQSIILRDSLYHNKFRYMIEFKLNEQFMINIATPLKETLEELPEGTWHSYGLDFSDYLYNTKKLMTRKYKSVRIYLTTNEDFIFFKIMGGEFITENHEVVLFNEL